MILLIATLCASAAMDDCQVNKLGQFETPAQCEALAAIHRQILGEGPDQNYRLECLDEND